MLKLSALDSDDLTVISAQMQDAVLKVSDMRYIKKRHQFALVANRFAWDSQPAKERRRTGLHINGVLKAERSGFSHLRDETVLSLLSISFEAGAEGAGVVVLRFSAGPSIRLHVEVLDVYLNDLGSAWRAGHVPKHGLPL